MVRNDLGLGMESSWQAAHGIFRGMKVFAGFGILVEDYGVSAYRVLVVMKAQLHGKALRVKIWIIAAISTCRRIEARMIDVEKS